MASTAAANGGIPSSSPMAAAGSVSSADKKVSSPTPLSTYSVTAPGSPVGVGSAPELSVFKRKKHVALWDVDGPGIESWISTIPGPFQSCDPAPASGPASGDKNVKDGSPTPNTTTSIANPGTYGHAILHRKSTLACI